jgi:hypothetical protein
VHPRVSLELEDGALGVGLHGLGGEADAPRHLLRVEALGEQLQDLPLALGERGVRPDLGHEEGGRQRRVHERLARHHRADGAQQVLGRGALHHIAAGARGDGVGEQALVAIGGEHDRLHLGARLGDPLDGGDAVDARQADVHDHDLGTQPADRLDHLLAGLHVTDQLQIGGIPEHEAQSLFHRRMVVDGQALGWFGHHTKP